MSPWFNRARETDFRWFAGMKGVFVHKRNSKYDDVKGLRYHFPKVYKSRVDQMLGDWFVYYEENKNQTGRFYTSCAKVVNVRPDLKAKDHFYADLGGYLDFDRPVPYTENGGYESRLVMPDGRINGGTAQSAVRLIDEIEFNKIVNAGLSEEPAWPDRNDEDEPDKDQGIVPLDAYDFGPGQPELIGAPANRRIVEQLISRKWRDKKFKFHVRRAYDRTCAFTGLRLINGKGRPEVEAAHIRPVEHGGNDWVRNGIALSGTVHWMFDRGLLSLSEDLTILQSRKLNHDLSNILVTDMRAQVPDREDLRPHPEYLKWHRVNHGFEI